MKKEKRVWLRVDEKMFDTVSASAERDYRNVNQQLRWLIQLGLSVRNQFLGKDRIGKFRQRMAPA